MDGRGSRVEGRGSTDAPDRRFPISMGLEKMKFDRVLLEKHRQMANGGSLWVEGRGSSVQGPGSRVQGPGSRVEGRGAVLKVGTGCARPGSSSAVEEKTSTSNFQLRTSN